MGEWVVPDRERQFEGRADKWGGTVKAEKGAAPDQRKAGVSMTSAWTMMKG